MQSSTTTALSPKESRQRRPDVRLRAIAITAIGTIALGAFIAWGPQLLTNKSLPSLRFGELFAANQPTAADRDIKSRFEQGVMMLHMRQYEFALTAFHQVLSLAPRMPEAHVNMGFALLGLEQWQQARDFFESATNLHREQFNAYYGMAIALEELGDIPGALGAMQTYLHRAPEDDPFRPHAEAALWEWREAVQPADDKTIKASPESGTAK
jgi:tetratricopeptide (TPR) repeat protein